MDTRTLGQVLEALRADGGLTLNGLSQTSGIPLTTLHRLFRDQVAKPNPAHLATLARVLGTPAGALMAVAGYPTSDAPQGLDAALRMAYPLPDEAIAEMHAALEAVAAKYAGDAL